MNIGEEKKEEEKKSILQKETTDLACAKIAIIRPIDIHLYLTINFPQFHSQLTHSSDRAITTFQRIIAIHCETRDLVSPIFNRCDLLIRDDPLDEG